eukprot:301252_1
MSTLQQTKKANDKIKCTVFGYIREHDGSESFRVPLLISYTCLAYYYIPEFISKAREDYFEISDDKMTVTLNNDRCDVSNHTIYCHQSIPSTYNIIAKWTFITNSDLCFFGISSNDNMSHTDFCSEENKPCYQLRSDGGKYSHVKPLGDTVIATDIRFNVGDTVTFTLDLSCNKTNNGIFSIQINESKDIIIFDNIYKDPTIEYKLCLQIVTQLKSSITLQSYEEFSY